VANGPEINEVHDEKSYVVTEGDSMDLDSILNTCSE